MNVSHTSRGWSGTPGIGRLIDDVPLLAGADGRRKGRDGVAFATRKRRPGFYRDAQVPDPLTTRGTLANRFRIQDDTFNNDYR